MSTKSKNLAKRETETAATKLVVVDAGGKPTALSIDPASIPRVIHLPRSAMLEGFQRLGGLRFFIRGILRTYGAAKEDVALVVNAVDGAVEEKEPVELSIKVGKRGTWTMVLS